MSLSLVAGPANAGKVALLLERYLARLDDEPFLIVPNRADVDRVERDLLRRCGCLLGGSIGTFDDLFERIAAGDAVPRQVATDAQRALVARRAIERRVHGSTASRGRRGSAASPTRCSRRWASSNPGFVDPEELDGELAELYAAYRGELDRLGLWDRDVLRRRAAERLQRDLDAWHGEPVFAYGFEDLTAAEWSLLEALAGRADVEVSLPYEPGRVAFASLKRTAEDLAALAGGRTEELAPRFAEYAAPALAHLERTLFEPNSFTDETHGAVRFLEGAGTRGTLELVGEELLGLLREQTPAEQIALVVPSIDRWRGPLETVLGSLGIPYAVEERVRLASTPLGQALQSLLRFAWAGGPAGSCTPSCARRTRGSRARASTSPRAGCAAGPSTRPGASRRRRSGLREAPLVALRELRAAESPVAATRALLESMIHAAYGLENPPASETSRIDLRCYSAAVGLLDELDGFDDVVSAEDLLSALDRCDVRLAAPAEPGRVAVLDLLRARTRRFEVVFLLGLEEGSLPRRDRPSAFLDDDRPARARPAARAAGLGEPRPVPLLHRVHARDAAPLPRARGGHRRRLAARGEPVLGRGRRGLRPGRSPALDEAACAFRPDVGDRLRSERPRAAPLPGRALG